MKSKLTILALLFCFCALAQDTQAPTTFQKRAEAAMEAQNGKDSITIRKDTTKNWKKYLVQPTKKLTWWEITKQFVSGMWEKNPFMVAIMGIFLLIGLVRLVKFFIK
jgi:hypothetical protein